MKRLIKLTSAVIISSCIIGLISSIFLQMLDLAGTLRSTRTLVLIPVVGVLTAFCYSKLGENLKKGNNLVIETADGGNPKRIPLRMAFMTFIFTILTHLSGASAGREGTAVQIGGTVTSTASSIFRLGRGDTRTMILSGISAGFGSVFGTPFAGAIFGLEVCGIGNLRYSAVIPCFASAYIADFTARIAGAVHEGHIIDTVPPLSPLLLIALVCAAVAFGIVGREFSVCIRLIKNFWAHVIKNIYLRALAASLVVLACILIFGLYDYEGLSTWLIDSGFNGTSDIADPFWKFILTSLTLGAGFQGGEVTPLFGIGSSLGSCIAQLFGQPSALFAAVGMICVFGSAANTPLATIALGIELFGTEALPFIVLCALISYLVSGHRGIYGSQKIITPKLRSFARISGKRLSALTDKTKK